MQPETTDTTLTQVLLFISDILKIFLGAFLGAACAFIYERRRKKDEDYFKRQTALRDAQFGLYSRIGSLLTIYTQYLAEQKSNPNRWVELHPVLSVTTPPPIPLAELSFLLDDIDPPLLEKLYVACDKFDSVLAIIAHRNEMHDEFQRMYEKKEISERLHVQLTSFTDYLYAQLPEALAYMDTEFDNLEQVMKKHFKGVTALRYGKEIKQRISDLQHIATRSSRCSP